MYDAVREYRRDHRAKKMRVYNARHRARLRDDGVPSTREVREFAWDMLMSARDVTPFATRLVQRLSDGGYDPEQAAAVVRRMVGPRTNVDTLLQA